MTQSSRNCKQTIGNISTSIASTIPAKVAVWHRTKIRRRSRRLAPHSAWHVRIDSASLRCHLLPACIATSLRCHRTIVVRLRPARGLCCSMHVWGVACATASCPARGRSRLFCGNAWVHLFQPTQQFLLVSCQLYSHGRMQRCNSPRLEKIVLPAQFGRLLSGCGPRHLSFHERAGRQVPSR